MHILGPPLDVAFDAGRGIAALEGRFVGSGCKPNAVLMPEVICEGSEEKKPERPSERPRFRRRRKEGNR